MENMEKKGQLQVLMQTTMNKIHEMVDTNNIVGQPITTQDGVTLIPISRVSFGFGSGGGDYGKNSAKENFGGGSAAGVKIDPVAFLIIKDGTT
ncbi:MAG: sporulation protein YtfJ, partial [Oscillibacter sp.]|nr:sporulation protein YtfJ [Oscillibacter sp.]